MFKIQIKCLIYFLINYLSDGVQLGYSTRNQRCPFQTEMYPKDPLVFHGRHFELCCKIRNTRNTTASDILMQHSDNAVTFQFGKDTIGGAYLKSTDELCVSVAADRLYDDAMYVCYPTSFNECGDGEIVRVEEQLPTELSVESCVIFDYEKLVCTLNAPKLSHPENSKTFMSWEASGKCSSPLRRDPCVSTTTCEVGADRLQGWAYHNCDYTATVTLAYKDLDHPNSNTYFISSKPVLIDGLLDVKLSSVKDLYSWSLNSSCINITWTPISVPNCLMEIQATKSGDHDSQTTQQNTQLKVTEAGNQLNQDAVCGLRPFSEYKISVRVRVNTSLVWSRPSVTSCVTYPDVPEKPEIVNASVHFLNKTHIVVYWKELNDADWNSDKQRGYLLYLFHKSRLIQTLESQFSKPFAILPLRENYGLKISIASKNDIGRSKTESTIVISSTKLRSEPIKTIEIIKKSNNSVSLTWKTNKVSESKVFWCKRSSTKEICEGSINWTPDLRRSVNRMSLSLREPSSYMYGVSVKQPGRGHSGIVWSSCILVKTGSEAKYEGVCGKSQVSSRRVGDKKSFLESKAWVALVLVAVVILLLLVPIFLTKSYKKKKKRFEDVDILVIPPKTERRSLLEITSLNFPKTILNEFTKEAKNIVRPDSHVTQIKTEGNKSLNYTFLELTNQEIESIHIEEETSSSDEANQETTLKKFGAENSNLEIILDSSSTTANSHIVLNSEEENTFSSSFENSSSSAMDRSSADQSDPSTSLQISPYCFIINSFAEENTRLAPSKNKTDSSINTLLVEESSRFVPRERGEHSVIPNSSVGKCKEPVSRQLITNASLKMFPSQQNTFSASCESSLCSSKINSGVVSCGNNACPLSNNYSEEINRSIPRESVPIFSMKNVTKK